MAVLKDTVKKGIKGRFRLEDIAQKDANTTRVITLSDTHKLTIELVRGAVDLARKTNADAILIAGDFVDGGRFYEILEDKGYNKEVYRQWDTLIHQIFNSTPGDGSEEIFKNYFEVNGMNARQIEAFKRNFAVHHHIKQEIGRLFEIECMEKTAYMCKELEQKPENCKIGIILGNHEPTSCLNPLVIPQEWIIPCNGINEDQGVLQINDHFQVIGHVGSSERYAGLPDHMYSHLSSVREGRHYREALLRWKAKMGEGKLEDLRREMLKEDKTYDRLKKHLKKGTILVTHKSSSPNGANEEKHPDSMDVDWGAYNAVTEAVQDTDNNPKGSIVEMTGHMHDPKVTWRGVTPVQRTAGQDMFITDFDNATQTRKKIHHVEMQGVYDPKEFKKYFEVTIPKYNLAIRRKFGIESLIEKGIVKRKSWERLPAKAA